jgi:hypothetical protein
MPITVVQNVERNTVIIYRPRCEICQQTMESRGFIAPPPERNIPEDQQFAVVGALTFYCQKHPHNFLMLNEEQRKLINTYPISRIQTRDTNLYNRKFRRGSKRRLKK